MANSVRFGEFRYDRDAGVLYRGGELVPLPGRALAVLACLLAADGDVVRKEEILDTAWPDSFVGEDALTEAISKLRSGLGDDPKHPEFIMTVPRVGYRFIKSSGATAADPHPEESRSWLPLAALAAAVLVVVALWVGTSRESAPGSPELGYERIRTLALILETSDDLDDDATRAALVDRIEREARLTVVAADAAADARLRVVFESVGERLQITARVHGADGANWWGQEWDLPVWIYADDRFARSMLSRLQFLLDATSAFSTAVNGSTSYEAMLLAVRASDLMLDEAQHDLQLGRQAAADLARARDLDPAFARARAGWIAVRAETAEWRDWSAEELEFAQREIESLLAEAPRDPVVHVANALLAGLEGDLERMAAALDRAETLRPSLFWIYMARVGLELALGRDETALATANFGVEQDPYLPSLLGGLIDVQFRLNDLDAVEATLATLTAIDVKEGQEGYWSGRARARLLLARGDLDGAETQLLALRERWANTSWIHQELVRFYTARGDTAAAAAATERFDSLIRE